MEKKRAKMTEALRKAARESGLSRYAIARGAGLEYASLARFLDGKQSLRLDKADALADFLGLEVTKQKGGRGGKRV
jgi:cyanate lyase